MNHNKNCVCVCWLKWAMRGCILVPGRHTNIADEERIEDDFIESISLSSSLTLSFSLPAGISDTSGRCFSLLRSLSIWVVTDQQRKWVANTAKSIRLCVYRYLSRNNYYWFCPLFVYVSFCDIDRSSGTKQCAVVSIWCLFPKHSIRMNRLFMFWAHCFSHHRIFVRFFLCFADSPLFILHFR